MAKNGSVRSSLGSIAEIHEVFHRFDKSGDGKISGEELKDVIRSLRPSAPPEEAARMMEELDRDGNGFIDMDEFVAYFQTGVQNHAGGGKNNNSGNDNDVKDLKDAFDMYDLDRNGLISASELHAVMKRLGEKCSVRDCARMISKVDTDGDGYVNFEEFKKMMVNADA